MSVANKFKSVCTHIIAIIMAVIVWWCLSDKTGNDHWFEG